MKKPLELLREIRERGSYSTSVDTGQCGQRAQSPQLPELGRRRPRSYLDLADLLPRPGDLDVAALREAADADPERWRELTELELETLERQGLAGSGVWNVALARLHWVLVGVLNDYRAASAANGRQTC